MRADKFFAEKFSSRTKASEALKKGLILRSGKPLSPKDEVSEEDEFCFLSPEEEFVSNGGFKLARALEVFQESVEGGVFADLGASTGGFCDCLLKHNAAHVYCVDVGESQLDVNLREDKRVTMMDNTNARFLEPEHFPQTLDGVTADLSFISLKLVLPAIKRILPAGGRAFLLFKPQFECGREGLKKGGICPVKLHGKLLSDFYDFALLHSLAPKNIVNAPLREKKNVEYMIFLSSEGAPIEKWDFLKRAEKLYEENIYSQNHA